MEPYTLPTVYSDQETPDDGVSLGNQTVPDNTVSLANPVKNDIPNLDQGVIDQRAKKIQEGVGKHIQKSTEEIVEEIKAGRESTIRQIAASNLETERYLQKINTLRDLANKSAKPLDENEVSTILDPYNPNNRPIDPDSVVEKQYALKYVSSLNDALKALPASPVAEAKKEVPQQSEEAFLKGSELTAKMEFAAKIREELESTIKSQTWPGFIWDQVKQMWQPYNEAQLRGNVEGVGTVAGGVLLGENLQAQADAIFGLPFDQYTKALRKSVEGLKDNPSLAHHFVSYVEGLPATDRILDNAFTAMTPFDYAAIGRGVVNIGRKINLAKRTNNAVREYIRQADKVGTDLAKRSEVSGDLDSAASTTNTGIVLQELSGKPNPIAVATDDTLLTFMNQSKEKLATDVGNLRREQVTRIQDQFDASGRTLLQRIVDAARINRIPMPLAVQNAVNIVRESVKQYYPGLRNAILDVSNPLYEPRSNTYWHEIVFGNFGGTLFSNENTARNFAKIHGFDDVRIVEGTGPLASKDLQALLDKQAKLKQDIAGVEHAIEQNSRRMRDTALEEKAKTNAKEQYELLSGYKRTAEKELGDVELRLKGEQYHDRVSNLQSEVQRLRAENKENNARLKAAKGMSEEDKAVIKSFNEANIRRVAEATQEIKAIRGNKASVLGPATVQQHGVGFKIVVRRPLVETDKAVRDLMIRDVKGNLIPEAISTSSATGWKSLMNAAIGQLRGADDTLALNESINRKIGTYTQNLFKEWADQEAKYIKQIATGVIKEDPVTGQPIPYWKSKPVALMNKFSKPYTDVKTGEKLTTYNAFKRTLEHARDMKDPDTGLPGYFFQTPGEITDHYLKYFGHEPSYAEHQAYFAFVRMVEGDRILRELAEFRNRARLGVEQFSLSMRDGFGKDMTTVKSGFFDGRVLDHFPGGDGVLMVMSRRKGEEKIGNLGGAAFSPKQIEKFRNDIAQGRLQAIEIYAPEHRPLRDFSDIAGNEIIRYVLVETSERKPIEFNHVNRRGGGHFEYDYDHFIKQPNMYHQYENANGVKGRFKSVYIGDTTFMPLLNRAMGEDLIKHLHEIQRLIREGLLEEAKNYTEANLPIEWDQLHKMFKPGRDEAGKVVPPQLDLHEKFYVVPKNRTVLDLNKDLEAKYGKSFQDAAKSGSLNKQFQVAYNTERESAGLRHIEDAGTQGNPLYKYAPESKMVDPITTMNRALNRIVNTVFMDDYKIYAVEHWLREAETHLKASQSEIYSSPFFHFQNAIDKSAFKPGTPWEVVRNLLSNRYKITQFVGVPSSFDTAIHSAKQTLVDWSYRSFGPEASRNILEKSITIIPNWMLSHIRDPITFMRSMTFHEKLGLFNPAQFLVQAQTYATIYSVAGIKNASKGTTAALLHQWTRLNASPEIINAMDRYAMKMGWGAGEFKEAYEILTKQTAFEKVAGEYANLNTALKTDFVGNDFKSFLNAGTFFFKEGERSTRLGAWYTAFKEFRDLNPTGPITKSDIGKILNRADLLTVNMSRASNSMLHSGVLSLTTQFLTYQLRLAELFMGTRLGATTAERMKARARIITFYSLLYGAPSAIGVTGLPFANSIRQEAIERGYVLGDNWLSTALDQGLPAMAAAHITGGGDWKKGNNYNFGDRYGSPGFTQISDALKSDHAWWQLLAGASGTTLLDQITSTSNFFHSMASILKPRNEDKAFPMKLDDFVDVFKSISTVNQTWKLIMAINTGKWMSKNEGYIGDVSKANAAFMAMTGTNPQQQDDAYIKASIRKDEEKMQKYILKEFIKEYRRGIQDAKEGNRTSAIEHYTRASTMLEIGGFPIDRKASAISMAIRGHESMIKDSDYKFALDSVPTSKSTFLGFSTPFTTQTSVPDVRREQYRRQLQVDQYKVQ